MDFEKASKEGYFAGVNYLEQMAKIMKYPSKKTAAFNNLVSLHEEWARQSSKKVAQIEPSTNEVVAHHESLYAAAAALGLSRQACGNISLACRNGGTRYKFKWKFI